MWVSKFFENWINTLWKIWDAATQTSQRENLSLFWFLLKAIRDSSLWAYYVFLKWEIDALVKREEINGVKNETSQQIAYLIWGYYLSPSVLLPIKERLEDEWISVKLINQRYYSKKSIQILVSDLHRKLRNDKGKDIVLFWYSAWWMVAHKMWSISWYSSVSFWLSEKPEETMVWTLLSLTKVWKIKDIKIPNSWVNIIETFSAMVPNTEVPENSVRLNDVFSHMIVWRWDVVEEIVSNIIWKFKRKFD